jgi:hypothetical protein
MHYAVFGVEDVHDLEAANAQRIGDHRAMTAPPDRFCAHHCGMLLTRQLEQLVQAEREFRG